MRPRSASASNQPLGGVLAGRVRPSHLKAREHSTKNVVKDADKVASRETGTASLGGRPEKFLRPPIQMPFHNLVSNGARGIRPKSRFRALSSELSLGRIQRGETWVKCHTWLPLPQWRNLLNADANSPGGHGERPSGHTKTVRANRRKLFCRCAIPGLLRADMNREKRVIPASHIMGVNGLDELTGYPGRQKA